MQEIVLDGVSKHFGEVRAVDDVQLTIESGELFTLLGPSGCGKTTLLRTIAGFYKQDKGDIYFGTRCINDVPTHERNIGMVFQNYAVFPHLSVFDNVAYGLRARKVPKREIETRVMEALEMVELADLRNRQPSDMSGGQQQRVALARAIVIRPALLLMDEPLSNLDAKLRIKMRSDIRRMQKELNITTIYVTHDQEEALAISDRIAVMHRGRVHQVAAPFELYHSPADRFVAGFIGETNFLNCTVQRFDAASGRAEVELLGTRFEAALQEAYEGPAVFGIRPEKVTLATEPNGSAHLSGIVESTTFLGSHMVYTVRVSDGSTLAVQQSVQEPGDLLADGKMVYLQFTPGQGILFAGKGERAIGRA